MSAESSQDPSSLSAFCEEEFPEGPAELLPEVRASRRIYKFTDQIQGINVTSYTSCISTHTITWRRLLSYNSSSSHEFLWNLGTGIGPISSFIISRRLLTPGIENCASKSSELLKWTECTREAAVGSYLARFNFTKSTHFFLCAFASVQSSP